MKQTLILGNIVTMDEKRPFAKAALAKDGVFVFIGSVEDAKKLADADAEVLDYGENFIYPGFLESHTHGYLAGNRLIGQANLAQVRLTDYDRYREIIKEFIEKNPRRTFYMAAGWMEDEQYVSKAYLDGICSDKPLIMHSSGGHSMLLNTKALEMFGVDAAYAKKYGYDQVHVDENGEPDGYICEGPVFEITPKLPVTLEEAEEYILAWQDYALRGGFTAVADAGAEVANAIAPTAYHELEKQGKLKLRTYAYMYVTDNLENPKAEVARIAAQRVTLSGEYFHIIGPKAFLDGVTEWTASPRPTRAGRTRIIWISPATTVWNVSMITIRWWNCSWNPTGRECQSMFIPKAAARPTSCLAASRTQRRSPAIRTSGMSLPICTL